MSDKMALAHTNRLGAPAVKPGVASNPNDLQQLLERLADQIDALGSNFLDLENQFPLTNSRLLQVATQSDDSNSVELDTTFTAIDVSITVPIAGTYQVWMSSSIFQDSGEEGLIELNLHVNDVAASTPSPGKQMYFNAGLDSAAQGVTLAASNIAACGVFSFEKDDVLTVKGKKQADPGGGEVTTAGNTTLIMHGPI